MHDAMIDLQHSVLPSSVGGPEMSLGTAAAPGVQGFGQLVKLVQFSPDVSPDNRRLLRPARPLSASLFSSGGSGPIVGIVTWGSGNGGSQSVEFDVPTPGQTGAAFLGAGLTSRGGVLLTVLGTSITVAARNDALLIPRAGDAQLGVSNFPATATASIAESIRAGSSNLTRTLYGAFNPAGGLAAAGAVTLVVPGFARKFTVFRGDTAQTCTVALLNNAGATIDGPYAIAAGAPSPTFILPGNAGEVILTNTGGGAQPAIGCVFELGL